MSSSLVHSQIIRSLVSFNFDIRSRWNDVHSLRRCPAGGLELPPLAVETALLAISS